MSTDLTFHDAQNFPLFNHLLEWFSSRFKNDSTEWKRKKEQNVVTIYSYAQFKNKSNQRGGIRAEETLLHFQLFEQVAIQQNEYFYMASLL